MTPSAERDSTRDLLEAVDSSWTGTPPDVAPISSPDVTSLDAGWEEEDAADEEPLPDARLDPIAYAEAKEAREARMLARREKRRAKTSAKRGKQKARGAAAQEKQKAKTKRSLRPAQAQAKTTDDVEAAAVPADSVLMPTLAPPKLSPAKISSNAKLLALGIVIFLAASAVVAALANR